MNIGFDLDKIFINYPPFIPAGLIDRLYKKKSNGQLLYRIPSKPEQFIRKASHLPLFRPHIKENLAFLKSIPKKEHKLFLISSRFNFLKDETENVAKQLGFYDIFEKMFFNFQNKQPHEFKNDVIKKLELHIYIDDDFPLLKYVAKQNKKTQFFWFNTKRKKGKLTKNITVINTLSDVFKNYAPK